MLFAKYANLYKSLPTNASVSSGIQAGDLMMFSSKTLVLFYKEFSTFILYTKIGKIDDVTGLVAALGGSNESNTFRFRK